MDTIATFTRDSTAARMPRLAEDSVPVFAAAFISGPVPDFTGASAAPSIPDRIRASEGDFGTAAVTADSDSQGGIPLTVESHRAIPLFFTLSLSGRRAVR